MQNANLKYINLLRPNLLYACKSELLNLAVIKAIVEKLGVDVDSFRYICALPEQVQHSARSRRNISLVAPPSSGKTR